MIYTELTTAAMCIAYEAHKDMRDKSGAPYIFHPFYVAEQMTDERTTAAALLHDVLEDTELTAADLLEQGISETVVRLVETLTRRENEDYFDYIRRLKQEPDAVRIKIADLRHNSDLSRLVSVSEKDAKRNEKYAEALRILTQD